MSGKQNLILWEYHAGRLAGKQAEDAASLPYAWRQASLRLMSSNWPDSHEQENACKKVCCRVMRPA